MVTEFPYRTSKLIAEIDYTLKVDFMKKVASNGQSQRFVIEKLVKDYLAQTEGDPKGFPKKIIRRTRDEQ